MDFERLLSLLERIAVALEAGNESHAADPDTMKRLLAIQERNVAAAEEHNRHHRDYGLPPAEPTKHT